MEQQDGKEKTSDTAGSPLGKRRSKAAIICIAGFFVVGVLAVTLFLLVKKKPVGLFQGGACPKYPAQILDLSSWKETLPAGKNKNPKEISQPKLATFSDSSYFFVNQSCDGVVFRAPVNGVTTSGTDYPRSELRQMDADGKEASWSTDEGMHTMLIEEAITAIPKNKSQIVAGQIHDANDDVVVIRLEEARLFVDINGKSGPTLDDNYILGKRFTVRFVAGNGRIEIYYDNNSEPAFSMQKSDSNCYFKAGAYTQSNCKKESDCSSGNYGEVVIYRLELEG